MIWKLLIFAAVGYALYRMFMNDKGKKVENTKKEKEDMVASGLMVKDPICGAYVDTDAAISVRNGGEVIRFCSYECREKYIKQIEEQGKLD